ncbi:penicillin amidase [Microlunatus sagamiharensis]|uniref:Penicillin amidase n=1 Tax=Microlunatus sagamiharensis TaxID=546874 RepID=A0A1H2MY42_9ACTN|nr:penicillin acylase family protein [Microlunatus sagamiharensis]SDU97436.1 penicillin amidase [Microlunatus sagamiharensis]
MRLVPRWLVFALVVVVLVAGGLVSLGAATVRRPLPMLEGEVTLPGLNGRATVLREDHGVPQVYADEPEDLFEAQGYVAASDRFFEMDVRRHAAAGRLSELFGSSQVSTDTFVRTLGWYRTAEAELPLLSPSTRRYLDAYASGVNAYLRGRSPGQLSLEYSVLDLAGRVATPEPWTAVDSLAILKVFGWQLGSNADAETYRARATAAVGADRAADLFPGPLPGYDPIVTAGTVRGKAFDPDATGTTSAGPSGTVAATEGTGAVEASARARETLTGLFGSGDGIGSNSWVVSGAHTASGKPMLSNDPHLAASIPSVLAQVGLHCGTVGRDCPFDVTGYSITGLPGVVIGRNASIAWGMTTSYADVQDLYLEQVVGDTVRVGEAYEPLTVRTEELRVAGEDEPRTITVRSTRHGPLLSDADPATADAGRRTDAPGGAYAVSIAWTGSTPGRSMDALLGLDAASDWDSFRSAASLLTVPSQNLVYADVRGNIGYQLPGLVPVRGRGDGTVPVPGWDRRYDWTGTIPFAELPFVENPSSGVVVAANNQVIGSQYPYVVGSANSYGWRSQELLDRLTDARGLTAATAEPLFYDTRQRFAADLVPALLKVRVDDAFVREGQQTLLGWDYRMEPGSAAAAYFAVVEHDLEKLVFRDQLPPALWPAGGDRWYAVLDTLLQDPDNPWWDDASTPGVEKRDDVLLAAMTLARKEATSLMSRDPAGWSWDRIHTVALKSSTLGTSGNPAVEALFNRKPVGVGGAPATVNALAYGADGYTVTAGPTMRMLVDLADPDGGRWVNQSGASGHPFGPYYADQAELWATNRTWPMVTTRNAVAAQTRHTLVLTPDG